MFENVLSEGAAREIIDEVTSQTVFISGRSNFFPALCKKNY